MTHKKRLPAPKHYPIHRKQGKYVAEIKGSRSEENAIPALLFLREVTGYAETAKEARKIVEQGKILRNGEELRDVKQGIGVLDVIELPDAEESYRIIKKPKEIAFIPVEDGNKVAAKIEAKKKEGEYYVYRLHNGENYRTEEEYSTGDTLVFNGNVKTIALEEGSRVLVVDGKHAGEVADVKEIKERGIKDDIVRVESEYEFETQEENLIAIGEIEVKTE